MNVNICLICLKTFESYSNESHEAGGLPLLQKFLKFADNYLQISSQAKLLVTYNANANAFCEKCELAVINPICQIYLQLLSTQLRLSWELGQLGALLENSERALSPNLRLINLSLLTNQLGIDYVDRVEQFRSLLTQKCRLRRKESFPDVLVERFKNGDGGIGTNSTTLKRSPVATTFSLLESALTRADVEAEVGEPLGMEYDSTPFNGNHSAPEAETAVEAIDPLDLHGSADERAEMLKIGIEGQDFIKGETYVDNELELEFIDENDDDAQEDLVEVSATFDEQNCSSRSSSTSASANRLNVEPELSANGFLCPICTRCFKHRRNAQTHIKEIHHEQDKEKCELCGKEFLRKRNLARHKEQVHSKDILPDEIYHCKHCNKQFHSLYNVYSHLNEKHGGVFAQGRLIQADNG